MQNNTETSTTWTQLSIMDELTSSQEDSPANPTQSLESERERRTNATCGRRCLELFESVHPVGSWERTFAGLLVGTEGWFSRRCVLTWKLQGTPYNRLYFQLRVSTLPTEETESGLLLTPTTREEVTDLDKFKERMEKYDNGTTVPNLATQVVDMLPTPTKFDYNTPRSQEAWDNAKEKHGDALQNPLKQMAAFGMLPTPVATDVEGGAVSNVQNDGKGWYRKNAKGERWGVKLRDVVESGLLPTPTTDERDTKYAQGGTNLRAAMQMLPTPCAQEHDKITGKENQDSLTKRSRLQTGKTSQLSPLFVEEMMGFPKNWTALPFQSGGENQSKPTATPSCPK